jgi:hypothetical protein
MPDLSMNHIVTWLFVTTNTFRLVAYLPQFLAALRCRNGASSISRATWGYFALSHFTGHLYSSQVLHDPKMATVFLGNFIACGALVALVTWKKLALRTVQSSRAT